MNQNISELLTSDVSQIVLPSSLFLITQTPKVGFGRSPVILCSLVEPENSTTIDPPVSAITI
jgi:hypothetical protein